MKGGGIWVHVALLAVACVLSAYVWTRDKPAAAGAVADVTVWSGRPADVQRISFESSNRKVALEARSDAHGRWFYGTSQTTASSPDAGASTKTAYFASVAVGEKISEALAPFKALRAIGHIDPSRTEEFGFKQPASTLLVTVAGKEHRLTAGAETPSGTDRYLRDEGTGNVYAARGDIVRELESGENSLAEREVHDFTDSEITSIRISSEGKTRELVRRGPAGKRIWADPSTPDKAEEAVANWLTKVDRLRPGEYEGDVPANLQVVVRIDYKLHGSGTAFVEIARVVGDGAKSEYVMRTERTRLWAKAHSRWAEEAAQDVGTVLK